MAESTTATPIVEAILVEEKVPGKVRTFLTRNARKVAATAAITAGAAAFYVKGRMDGAAEANSEIDTLDLETGTYSTPIATPATEA